MGNIHDFGLPFTSVSGDRTYGSADWRAYFASMFGNGIMYGIGDQLAVGQQTSPNRTVSVATGAALVDGTLRVFQTPTTLELNENVSGSVRIDRIVVRLDYGGRLLRLAVRQGTPGAGAPALQRDATYWELSLAQVELANGYTGITDAMITDERTDEALCGYSVVRAFLVDLAAHEDDTENPHQVTAEQVGLGPTDPAAFLTVDTGNGANQVLRNSYEHLHDDISSTSPYTFTIGAMLVGETRWVDVTLDNNSGGVVSVTIALPAGGMYSAFASIATGSALRQAGGTAVVVTDVQPGTGKVVGMVQVRRIA